MNTPVSSSSRRILESPQRAERRSRPAIASRDLHANQPAHAHARTHIIRQRISKSRVPAPEQSLTEAVAPVPLAADAADEARDATRSEPEQTQHTRQQWLVEKQVKRKAHRDLTSASCGQSRGDQRVPRASGATLLLNANHRNLRLLRLLLLLSERARWHLRQVDGPRAGRCIIWYTTTDYSSRSINQQRKRGSREAQQEATARTEPSRLPRLLRWWRLLRLRGTPRAHSGLRHSRRSAPAAAAAASAKNQHPVNQHPMHHARTTDAND